MKSVLRGIIDGGIIFICYFLSTLYVASLWMGVIEFRGMISFLLVAEGFILAIRGIDKMSYPESQTEDILRKRRQRYYRKCSKVRLAGYVILMGMSALLLVSLNTAIMGMMIFSLLLLFCVYVVFIAGN